MIYYKFIKIDIDIKIIFIFVFIMEEYKIPLRNKNGDVIDYALVSQEDFNKVNERKWNKQIATTTLFYALSNQNRDTVRMHQYILGKAPDGFIIDHINNNGLDNRRENLRFITQSQNIQNTEKRENLTSKYKGVSYNKRLDKWRMQFGHNEWYEYHEIEENAAKRYDIYVLLKFGKDARTNNLILWDDVKDLKLEEEFKKEVTKTLPIGIHFRKDSQKYVVEILHNKVKYIKSHAVLDDAIKDLEYQRKLIASSKDLETKLHFEKEILKNNLGQPIIKIKDIEVILDDEHWHELSQFNWYIAHGYVRSEIDKKQISMHYYVMKLNNIIPQENEIIDHINHIKHDNRKNNLRINSRSGNSHNKKKKNGSASKYLGVSRNGVNWRSTVIHNGIEYRCGTYKTEVEAALAYNTKATELYGEFANLNNI